MIYHRGQDVEFNMINRCILFLATILLIPFNTMALSCMPTGPDHVDVLFKGTITGINTIKPVDRSKFMDFSQDIITVAVEWTEKGEFLIDDDGNIAPVNVHINNYDAWGGPYVSLGETRWFGGRKNNETGDIMIGACELYYDYSQFDKEQIKSNPLDREKNDDSVVEADEKLHKDLFH